MFTLCSNLLLHCRPICFRGNAVVFFPKSWQASWIQALAQHTQPISPRCFQGFTGGFFQQNIGHLTIVFFLPMWKWKSENDPSPCLGKTVNPFETVKCWTTTVAMAFGRQRHNHSLKLCDSIWELVMAWDRQGSSSDSIRVSSLGASSTSA